jgi:hypothetical protein
VPEVFSAPLQPPDAAHVVASVALQVSVAASPATTVVGLALSVTTGGGALTVTVTLAEPSPPGPVQASEYFVVVSRTPVENVPDTACAPVQPPVAVQVVAPAALHVSTAPLPLATAAGDAVSETLGAGCGVAEPCCEQDASVSVATSTLAVATRRLRSLGRARGNEIVSNI